MRTWIPYQIAIGILDRRRMQWNEMTFEGNNPSLKITDLYFSDKSPTRKFKTHKKSVLTSIFYSISSLVYFIFYGRNIVRKADGTGILQEL